MAVIPRSLLILALGAVLASPMAAQAAPPPSPMPYAALAAVEARVAAIGFRLTTANARWCPRLAPQLGWILGDPRQYPADRRDRARLAYGAGQPDQVYMAALAPDGPAARAGLTVGRSPAMVGGQAPAPSDTGAFGRIAAWEVALSQLSPDAPISLLLADGALATVTPRPGCASDFRVEAKDKPAAAADGRLVLVSAGLAQFAPDDAELAAAIAHELAHNILSHRDRLDAAGVRRGLLRQFGRNARLFRQTEVEADRLSVWLMNDAGYDPDAAARFWTRFGKQYGQGLFQAGTHPRWRDRVTTLTDETAILHSARLTNRDAPPPLIAAPPPLE